jgi:cytochrome c5
VRSRGDAAVRVVLALALGAASLTAQALPEGPGANLVKARCATCHEIDLITSQRLSLAGWTREVDKMIRWGAQVSDADRVVLQLFLAQHFGSTSSVADVGSDPAMRVLQRACLTCHERDLIEAQRLTRAGWTREVEKMIRWGAVVSEADKDLLIAGLAAKYGPPPRAAR